MIVGVPKEIKEKEFRVGIVPSGVKALVQAGHTVLIEQGAGEGSGIDDAGYRAAGAGISATAAGSDPLHLSPPGPAPGADPGAARRPGERGGLRNGAARQW